MRDPIINYEARIKELKEKKDYKSTIWQSPEDEIIFLLKEIERINKLKQQGVKF